MAETSVLCGCVNYLCIRRISLPTGVAEEIRNKHHLVIIDGCLYGPLTTDQFIGRGDGYRVFREAVPITP